VPTFKVTDPDTGTVLRLTGDSAPTEAELEDIFSRVAQGELQQTTPQATPSQAPQQESPSFDQSTEQAKENPIVSTILGNLDLLSQG